MRATSAQQDALDYDRHDMPRAAHAVSALRVCCGHRDDIDYAFHCAAYIILLKPPLDIAGLVSIAFDLRWAIIYIIDTLLFCKKISSFADLHIHFLIWLNRWVSRYVLRYWRCLISLATGLPASMPFRRAFRPRHIYRSVEKPFK